MIDILNKLSCIAYKCKDIYTVGWIWKLYAWCNAYGKEVNAKVRNYDLRDLDNEMNRVRFYS